MKQNDLERRFASLTLRKDVLDVPIDVKIAGRDSSRDHRPDCVQVVNALSVTPMASRRPTK